MASNPDVEVKISVVIDDGYTKDTRVGSQVCLHCEGRIWAYRSPRAPDIVSWRTHADSVWCGMAPTTEAPGTNGMYRIMKPHEPRPPKDLSNTKALERWLAT